jgi:sugar lactone lactonase YvrE
MKKTEIHNGSVAAPVRTTNPPKAYIGIVLIAAMLVVVFAGCARLTALRRSLEGQTEDQTAASARETAEATKGQPSHPKVTPVLEEIAHSDVLWTGVAASRDGRIFVNFPRWSESVSISVGEIRAGGTVWPFPDAEWNTWDPQQDPAHNFVCVQSVFVDHNDFMWVLDTGNAYLEGVVAGGAKLVKIDLQRSSVVQEIPLDDAVAPSSSYLNDVRIDTAKNVAYITDSGLGALVVVDLATGKGRRVLTDHGSTKSENIVLTIAGKEWRVNGQVPQVHADGLALDAKGEYLYYHALTAISLYRIKTRYLLDPNLTEQQLGVKVESLGTTGAVDGMEFGPDGYLYLTGIEENAIKTFASLGRTEILIKDPALLWPDSFARGEDGYMYVTTSQIHLGAKRTEPYRLFRFKIQ